MTTLPALPDDVAALLARPDAHDLVLFLTGAGVSAESGIPTFRGPEGYWTVGAREYHPMELATHAAFAHMPDEVWSWYLYRRGVCRAAAPNAAHRAIAALEAARGDAFLLVTQNVDGLHRRAGSTFARHYPIHGDVGRMRCARDCVVEHWPIPEEVDPDWARGRAVGERERALLVCPRCGGRARPHVLWFDEYYDEAHFRWDSSMGAADRAVLLVVVGTSGATNLPLHVAGRVAQRGVPILAVNPEPSPFTELAGRTGGAWLEGTAGTWVPPIARALGARLDDDG